MSWHVTYGSLHDFLKDIRAPASEPQGGSAEVIRQIAAARAAVRGVIATGAAGMEGVDYFIAINGHANPAHKPAHGYANDSIAISVTQKS